jgi:hypothetical protein
MPCDFPPRVRLSDIGLPRQEANMARKPDRLAYVFAMVLAMAMTVLTIKTWAGPPAPDSDSAAPIPPRETIYRPQHWNLY